MNTRRMLVSVAASLGFAVGCASAPNAHTAESSAWPRGSEPQLAAMNGVAFRAAGHVRFASRTPLYVLFLELRPSLDSVDVRISADMDPGVALTGVSELLTSMETVDALQPATASSQFANCSTVKLGAGDPTGQEVCPVSRSYGPEPSRTWRFRNRVFLLVSDRPFPTALPRAIPWAANRTTPPVVTGSKWTAFEL